MAKENAQTKTWTTWGEDDAQLESRNANRWSQGKRIDRAKESAQIDPKATLRWDRAKDKPLIEPRNTNAQIEPRKSHQQKARRGGQRTSGAKANAQLQSRNMYRYR